MQRIAFRLLVRKGKERAYDEAHRQVWPALLEEMEAMGIHDYSIFRRDRELFLYLKVHNWAEVREKLQASEVNAKWQQAMAEILEHHPDSGAYDTLEYFKEVFYMAGNPHQVGIN